MPPDPNAVAGPPLYLNLPPDIDHHDGIGEPHWERGERSMVARLVKPGMTCIDAGANVGDYTLLMSRLVGIVGRVHAFEPCVSTFDVLMGRCFAHDTGNVRLHPLALWSEKAELDFHEWDGPANVWNSAGEPEMGVPYARTTRVPAISLDEWWAAAEPFIGVIDYLKIDVEGAESDVLAGAKGLLAHHLIRMIQFEISFAPLKGMNRTPRQTFDPLLALGFRIFRIMSDGTLGPPADRATLPYENFIAFSPATGPIPEELFCRQGVIDGVPFSREVNNGHEASGV